MNPLTGKVQRKGTFDGYEVAGWRHSDHPSWNVKVWLAGCPRDWFGYTVTAGMFELKMFAHAQREAILHAIGAWDDELVDPKVRNESWHDGPFRSGGSCGSSGRPPGYARGSTGSVTVPPSIKLGSTKDTLCPHCNAPMSCDPGHGCGCSDLPNALPVPTQGTTGCLCRDCLMTQLKLHPPLASTSNE